MPGDHLYKCTSEAPIDKNMNQKGFRGDKCACGAVVQQAFCGCTIIVIVNASPVYWSNKLGIIHVCSRPHQNSTTSLCVHVTSILIYRHSAIDQLAINNRQPTRYFPDNPRTPASTLDSAVYHQLPKALWSVDLCVIVSDAPSV